MDPYVEKKLTEWNLIELKDNFRGNGIDEEAFKMLTAEFLKEIIPAVAPRLKFWSLYQNDKEQQCNKNGLRKFWRLSFLRNDIFSIFKKKKKLGKSVGLEETDKPRTDEPDVSGVKLKGVSRNDFGGAKRKIIDSSSSLNIGRDFNNITSAGSTSVNSSILGGDGNKIEITNKNVFEDRSKFKSKIPWKNVEKDYRKKLSSKPLMVLQGDITNKISMASLLRNVNAEGLEELIDDYTLYKLFDDYTLYKLIDDIDISVGTELPELEETEAYFIPRTFLPLEAQLNGERNVVDLINNMRTGETTIISDDAGTGKSVILKKMAREIKTMFPNRWVIFVNLRSYAAVFEKQLDSRNENIALDIENRFKDIAVNFFVSKIYHSKNNEHDFERNLLKWCLNKSGGVVLLFDGFDEISPKYKKIVKGLLLGLKNSRAENLIVSTRTHSAEYLKKDLNFSSYRMRPFNEEDKRNFIVKFWLLKSECDNESMLEAKANHLIELFSTSIEDNERQFMGIPLQCRLLAEVYRKKLNSLEEWDIMSLHELYRQFISMKFQEENEKYQNTTSTSGTENNELTRILVREYHWESAFRLLWGDNVVNKLKFQRLRKEAESCLVKKVERVGIITETGQTPVFIHRTFAEFFVADFLIDRLECLEVDRFWEAMDIWMNQVSHGFGVNTEVVLKFFESVLKSRKVEEGIFYLVHTKILKSWRQDSLDTFHKFRDFFQLLFEGSSSVMAFETTYRFLLRCIIFDGVMPIEILSLVAMVVPLPIKCSITTVIFLELISSCPKNVQVIILVHIFFRSNEMLVLETEDSFILMAMTFPGILVTWDSMEEKMSLFRDFLEASAAGDVGRLSTLLGEAGDDDTRFWLLNGGIYTDCDDDSHGTYFSLDNLHTYISALANAIENNRQTTLQFILNEGAATNSTINPDDGYAYISPLVSAIENHRQTALEFLLNEGAAPNPPINPDFCPPLFIAIKFGNLKFVKILLQRGADKDSKHKDETPLDFACRCGKTELVNLLLNVGCERTGSRALHLAVENGNTDVVRLLLDRGFNADQRGGLEKTPLHFAFFHKTQNSAKYLNIIEILVAHGADIAARDSIGTTALHLAAHLKETHLFQRSLTDGTSEDSQKSDYSKQSIQFLLAHGANIQAKDKFGQSPLHLVRDPEILSILLNNGALIEAVDSEGRTPLHGVVPDVNPEVIRSLLESGANIEAKDNEGNTPLHRAVSVDAPEVIRILLERGANIDVKDNKGRTPLHQAVLRKFAINHETIRLLLGHWVDIGAMDADGNTALQLAITEWDKEMGPLFFSAKEAGVSQEGPSTFSLKESLRFFTRNDIYSAIFAQLTLYVDEITIPYFQNDIAMYTVLKKICDVGFKVGTTKLKMINLGLTIHLLLKLESP